MPGSTGGEAHLRILVGVRGFEPPAPASRTRWFTRLSYTTNEACLGFMTSLETSWSEETEKVTFSHCVPTILHMLLSDPAAEAIDLSNWKVIIGGSALPPALAQRARDPP